MDAALTDALDMLNDHDERFHLHATHHDGTVTVQLSDGTRRMTRAEVIACADAMLRTLPPPPATSAGAPPAAPLSFTVGDGILLLCDVGIPLLIIVIVIIVLVNR